MDSEGEDGASDPEFAAELEGLKRDGSNVLVVGERSCHDSLCDRFLGADDGNDQRRIVVTVDPDRADRDRTESGIDDGYHLRYVPLSDDSVVDDRGKVNDSADVGDSAAVDDSADVDAPERGDDESNAEAEPTEPGSENRDTSGDGSTHRSDSNGADQASSSTTAPSRIGDATAGSSTSGTITLDAATIGILGKRFVDTIDSIESETDLEPSELRVCVDSISDLLAEDSAEVVFRLLHAMTMRSKHSRSMGHFHYYGDRDHEEVRLIEPLFDAVVSVRDDGGTVEHRWEVRDRETETDWIPV